MEQRETGPEQTSYDAFQTRKLQRVLIGFAIVLIPLSLAGCIIGFLLTGSWFALSSLSGLFASAWFFWHAFPMREQTYQRKLSKIREKAQRS